MATTGRLAFTEQAAILLFLFLAGAYMLNKIAVKVYLFRQAVCFLWGKDGSPFLLGEVLAPMFKALLKQDALLCIRLPFFFGLIAFRLFFRREIAVWTREVALPGQYRENPCIRRAYGVS